MIDVIKAIILGLVEGLTEFIPVSSTGHLILLGDMLNFATIPGKVFEIAIQLAAILAVSVIYHRRIWGIMKNMWQRGPEQVFATNIILAFLPAMMIGAVAHGFIKTHLFSPVVVAIMLIIGGIAILIIEKMHKAASIHDINDIKPTKALTIGLYQCLAMIPGVSRSGATIMGGLLLGINRKTITEFSFFLAIPTMLAATCYDLLKNWHNLNMADFELILIGGISAFIAALLVVRTLIAFISRHGFAPFAWYRIILGSVMLGLLYF